MVMPTEPGEGPHHGGLVRRTCEIPLQIESRYLGNVSEGIQEHLRPMLMTFNRELGGVALGFRDVRPVTKMAKILYENPGVHLRVSTSLLLFAPKVGDVLVGRVNFIGHDHIGLTVYDEFKASISQQEFPSTYRKVLADDDDNDDDDSAGGMRWEDSENPGGSLALGREVIFAVQKLQTAADGLLVIAGSMEDASGEASSTLGPTDAPIVLPPKSVRTQQRDETEEEEEEEEEEEAAAVEQRGGGGATKRRRSSGEADKAEAKRPKKELKPKQKKQKKPQQGSEALEQQMLQVSRFHDDNCCRSLAVVADTAAVPPPSVSVPARPNALANRSHVHQENSGAPLTHKQQRLLKKLKKTEEAAVKRAAAAAAQE